MSILGRYVFREILSSSVLATVLATFVIFLQGSRMLFELVIRSSARPETVLYLLALSMPPLLPLAIPFGALVGILVGLGRMSSDGEITAMRAAGIPSRRLILPVLALALLGTLLAGAASIRLNPLAARKWTEVVTKLAATQLTAEIQPRVFAEQFPNTILYVGDVRPTQGENVTIWRNVFMADVTPPDERRTGLGEQGRRAADHGGARGDGGRRPGAQPDPAVAARRQHARNRQGRQGDRRVFPARRTGARSVAAIHTSLDPCRSAR